MVAILHIFDLDYVQLHFKSKIWFYIPCNNRIRHVHCLFIKPRHWTVYIILFGCQPFWNQWWPLINNLKLTTLIYIFKINSACQIGILYTFVHSKRWILLRNLTILWFFIFLTFFLKMGGGVILISVDHTFFIIWTSLYHNWKEYKLPNILV